MGGNYKIGPEAIGSRSEVPRKFCMSIESYKDLIVWQKSIELVILTYRLTDKFPKSELKNFVSFKPTKSFGEFLIRHPELDSGSA